MKKHFKLFWQQYLDQCTPELLNLNKKYYEAEIDKKQQIIKNETYWLNLFLEQLEMIEAKIKENRSK